jgi:hypothetical protein
LLPSPPTISGVGKFFRNLSVMYDKLKMREEPGRIFNACETGLQVSSNQAR